MKNPCTSRILCSAIAVGAGLLLANNALADKGAVKPQGSPKGQTTATGTTKSARTPARQAGSASRANVPTSSAVKPGAEPAGGIAGGCAACPPGSIVEVEPDCGIPVDTVNGGCNSNPNVFGTIECGQTVCGTGAFNGSTRDTDWYKVVVTESTQLTFTGTAEFDLLIGIVNNFGIDSCSGVTSFLAFAQSPACTPGTATACVPAGTWYLFVAPDFTVPSACGAKYNATLTCAPCEVVPVCPNPDHDCCTQGTPGCSDEACCNTVCGIDPFCCSNSWDAICVGEANSFCGACPPPAVCGAGADHDCFTSGNPGCTDEVCCGNVCAIDAFCCSVFWDGLCVGEAFSAGCTPPVCAGATCPKGAGDEGEACGSDTNGGCNVAAGGASGNCCTANGGIGCEDPVCSASVCAADPFCCSVAWDGLCAGEALADPNCDCEPGVEQYSSISCGDTVCGTYWATGGTRDTDWYEFTVGTTGVTVTATVYASLPTALFIFPKACPPTVNIIGEGSCPTVATNGACVALDPGQYVVFVAPNIFDGAPCGGEVNNYVLTLDCQLPCPWDNTGNGFVNIDDLLGVINHWGACP